MTKYYLHYLTLILHGRVENEQVVNQQVEVDARAPCGVWNKVIHRA